MPKKPAVFRQKLKSRIGHVRVAATGFQCKKSRKANDSHLPNFLKFDDLLSKKIQLFYLHVRS
jgi:hypothetical protein